MRELEQQVDGTGADLEQQIRMAMIAGVVASLAAAVLLAADVGRGGGRLWFLAWNLVLAWVPFPAAMVAWRAARRGRAALAAAALGGWLLFLPNAPYIVTDALHLRSPHATRADVVLVAVFAACGLGAGLLSMRVAHESLRLMVGRVLSWATMFAAAALSALGVYLGRFVRFNSWDVFSNPTRVARVVIDLVVPPYYSAWTLVTVGGAAVMFVAAYALTYRALPLLAAVPSRVARARRP